MRKIKKTEVFLLLLLIIGILVLFIMVKVSDKEGKEDNEKETKTEDGNVSKAYFEQCKKLLLALGTPGEILADCSEEQIIFIAENLKEGEIYEAVDSFESSDKLISMTIICYSYKNNGERQYKFFPSFRWLEEGCGIGNDSFGFALNEDWEIVPGMPEQMKVCLENSDGMKHDKTYQCVNAGQCGYAYSFEEGIAVPDSYYEGYGVFCARRKNIDVAAVEISMTYVHDNSNMLTDEAYSLNISPGLVSVSSDSPKLQVYAQNMTFTIINDREDSY